MGSAIALLLNPSSLNSLQHYKSIEHEDSSESLCQLLIVEFRSALRLQSKFGLRDLYEALLEVGYLRSYRVDLTPQSQFLGKFELGRTIPQSATATLAFQG